MRRSPAANLPAPLSQRPTYRQLRRFCRQVVKAIGAEPPLAVDELCVAVGRLRGRPIVVDYRVLPPGVFGFSLPAPAPSPPADLVFVAANTTTPHREHILLHEVGHILAGHLDGGRSTASAHSPSGTTPVDEVQQREWVAESIATVLSERALLHQERFGDRPVDPASRALDEALRSGRSWI